MQYTRRPIALWPLALLAGLLPMVAALSALARSMQLALPLPGVGNAIVAALFDDGIKARVENVTEWWGSLIFVLGFLLIAVMWHRAGVALEVTGATDC